MIATHHVLFCFLPVLLLLTSYATATRSPLRTRSRSVSNQADPITKEVLRWMNAFLQQGDYPGGGNFNGVDDLVEDLVKRRMKNNVKTSAVIVAVDEGKNSVSCHYHLRTAEHLDDKLYSYPCEPSVTPVHGVAPSARFRSNTNGNIVHPSHVEVLGNAFLQNNCGMSKCTIAVIPLESEDSSLDGYELALELLRPLG
eukprot:Lankesteria_metandrocarpae@DN3714_c0_g1_i1.p1